MEVPQLLHDTMENLIDTELKTFQWYCTFKNLDGCQPIPRARLHNVSRSDTVYELTETYKDLAVKLTVVILKKMSKNSLAEELENKYAAASSSSAQSSSAAAAAAAAPGPSMNAQQGSVIFAPTVTSGTTGSWTVNIHKS